MDPAIAFGLAAAAMITTTLLATSRAIRLIGSASVLAWIGLIGLVITLPFVIAAGVPEGLTVVDGLLLLLIGVAQCGGFLLCFAAFRIGKVGVVAPIIATEGGIAAVMSAVVGERLALSAVAMLGLAVAGVMVAAVAPDPAPVDHERPVLSVVYAAGGALGFAAGLFLVGYLGAELPLSWVVLPPRIVATVALAIPLLVVGRLRLTRPALPLVSTAAVLEVLTNSAIGLGSRSSIAITSVLSAQYAVLTPIAAWALFRERLGRLQVLGVCLLALGVTGLALLR